MEKNVATREQVIDQMADEDPRELVVQLDWMRREFIASKERADRMKTLLDRKTSTKLNPTKKAQLVRRFTIADAYSKQVEQVIDQVEFRLSQLSVDKSE